MCRQKRTECRAWFVAEVARLRALALPCLALALLCLIPLQRAAAQNFDPLPSVYLNVSEEARKRLGLVDSYVKDGQWAEAVAMLQDLIEDFPDKVVAADPAQPEHFLNVRTVCHQQIAKFPAAALQMYRQRVDAPAGDLWNASQSSMQPWVEWKRISDEFFCSSIGDQAIHKLADHVFSSGDYVRALYLWSQLLPEPWRTDATEFPDPLVYFPGSTQDPARLSAKCVIAEILLERLPQAKHRLAKLRELAPEAAGNLAGQTGLYQKTLETLIGDSTWSKRAGSWPEFHTFAGDQSRSYVAPKPVDIGLVQWQWELSPKQPLPAAATPFRFGGADDEHLHFHPVVVGRFVHLATTQNLWMFDLDSGKADNWYSFEDDALGGGRAAPQTLTVDGDQLFVRAGINPQMINQRQMFQSRAAVSKLYCFDHRTQRQLWIKDSTEIGAQGYVFEGAPVVRGRFLYIGITRADATIETNVACLERDTGNLLWRTFVCESTNDSDQTDNHNLLSLAGDSIYYSTNLGAVASVDATTGTLNWVARYRRREAFLRRASADASLRPCVYADGRVFVAANDTDKVQCFDAVSGRKLWDASQNVDHLLGVAQGNLIATGDRVWGIDIRTGKVAWYWPENDARGFGRGVLADGNVYWPTINQIHVLDQRAGRVNRPPIELFDRLQTTGGNIVLGDGYLLLAQARGIVALFPYERLIEKLQEQLVQKPDSADLHVRLAQAAFQNQDFVLASEHFRLGAEHAIQGQTLEGMPLIELAKQKQFDSLVEQGRLRQTEKDYANADARFDDASKVAMDERQKIHVRVLQARMWKEAEQPAKAVALFQSILEEVGQQEPLIPDDSGRSLPISQWVGNEIEQTLADAGRESYASIDRRFGELAATTTDPEQLEKLAERHPNSQSRNEVFLKAARQYQEANRTRDARLLFKRVLHDPKASEDSQFESLVGLQRCHQAAGLAQPELIVLQRLQNQFAPRSLPGFASVSLFVRQRRSQLGSLISQERTGPTVLDKGFRLTQSGGEYFLPEGSAPLPAFRVIACHVANTFSCRDIETGNPRWEAGLEGKMVWTGYGPSGLLVGTDRILTCFGYESGDIVWQQKAVAIATDKEWKNPLQIVRPDTAEPGIATQFVSAGDSILCRSGDRVLALDVDTGSVQWQQLLAKGEDFSLTLADSSACVLGSEKLTLFDLHTGVKQLELPLQDASQTRLVVSNENLAVNVRRDEVTVIDLVTMKPRWTRKFRLPNFHWPCLYSSPQGLLIVHDGSQLLRHSWETGNEEWSVPISQRPQGWIPHQATLQGNLFVYTLNGWLEARDSRHGDLRWRTPLPRNASVTSPVALGECTALWGTGSAEGFLMVFRTSEGSVSQLLRFSELTEPVKLQLDPAQVFVTASNQAWALNRSTLAGATKSGGMND